MGDFFAKLKRGHIYRVAAAYAVVARVRIARYLQIGAAFGVLALAGCLSGETVYLRGPNGQIRQCGPRYYHLAVLWEQSQETEQELRLKCVTDYKREGFQQVPASPPSQMGDAVMMK